MTKIGRNAPCPCGSGKKYKKCCLAADEASARKARATTAAPPDPFSFGLDDVPGLDGGLRSPEACKLLEAQLPESARAEFGPLLDELQGVADFQEKQAEIEAAERVLEGHRTQFEALAQDPKAFMGRTEDLFSEPAFETMRFTLADLERAFESVGYPTSTPDAAFVAFAGRAIDALLDGKQRIALARRLICMLPEYVAQERYTDACIIHHSVKLICDPPQGGCAPFLLCMFMQGMRDWHDARGQEEQEMFGQLGIDVDDIRRHGPEGVGTVLARLGGSGDDMAAVETFLTAHPRLEAEMQARCREAENAAVALLSREEGQSLLLDDHELEPWLPVFVERTTGDAEILKVLEQRTEPPEDMRKRLANILLTTAEEMAEDIFTEPRMRRLSKDAEVLQDRLRALPGDESLALSGLFMATNGSLAPAQNHFLVMVCVHSLKRAIGSMCGLA